jgi:hypothetical protein
LPSRPGSESLYDAGRPADRDLVDTRGVAKPEMQLQRIMTAKAGRRDELAHLHDYPAADASPHCHSCTNSRTVRPCADELNAKPAPRRRIVPVDVIFLERTLDPSRFVRVHRSALVNLSRVREVVDGRWGDAVAVLRDGTRVRVSRTRREVLMAALGGKR